MTDARPVLREHARVWHSAGEEVALAPVLGVARAAEPVTCRTRAAIAPTRAAPTSERGLRRGGRAVLSRTLRAAAEAVTAREEPSALLDQDRTLHEEDGRVVARHPDRHAGADPERGELEDDRRRTIRVVDVVLGGTGVEEEVHYLWSRW